MNYLSRLAKYLSGILGGEESSTNTQRSFMDTNVQRTDGENLIVIKDIIIKSIVESLKMFKGNNTYASRLCLTIYILDNTIYSGLGLGHEDDAFRNALRDKIFTELGVTFKAICISKENLDDDKTLKGTDIGYLFYTLSEESKSCASIKAMKGYGSLSVDEVKLYPNPDQVYNIGRGKDVKTKTGMFRTNDISIDDSDECEEHSNNGYVSSCHAHIQYKKSIGFLLYVDEGGTMINGSRTRILRKSEKEPIDLGSNVKNGVPLLNGDIIELGKHVCLIFNYA